MITKESYIIDTFGEKEINYIELLADAAMMFIDYRRKNGLSQTGLAKKLGISQARVSKIESGDYNISLKNLSDYLFEIGQKLNLNCTQVNLKAKISDSESLLVVRAVNKTNVKRGCRSILKRLFQYLIMTTHK